MDDLPFRNFLTTLVVFLCFSSVIETILPDGNNRVYVRYFIGLLTVLFLLSLGSKIQIDSTLLSATLPSDNYSVDAETFENNRLKKLMEERIKEDVLEYFPECEEVIKVSVNESGEVTFVEIVANHLISKKKIAERYGVAMEQVVIRGVVEREENPADYKKAE